MTENMLLEEERYLRQSERLTSQQKESHGALWIFGDEAKTHDSLVKRAAISVRKHLQQKYTRLAFRFCSALHLNTASIMNTPAVKKSCLLLKT